VSDYAVAVGVGHADHGSHDPNGRNSGTHASRSGSKWKYRPQEKTWVDSARDRRRPLTATSPLRTGAGCAAEDSNYDQARLTRMTPSVAEQHCLEHGESSSQHTSIARGAFTGLPVSQYFLRHKMTIGWDLHSDGASSSVAGARRRVKSSRTVLDLRRWCEVGRPTGGTHGPENVTPPDKCRTDASADVGGGGPGDRHHGPRARSGLRGSRDRRSARRCAW